MNKRERNSIYFVDQNEQTKLIDIYLQIIVIILSNEIVKQTRKQSVSSVRQIFWIEAKI